MAHFAKMNGNQVENVIVINNDVFENLPFPKSETVGVDFCKSLFGSDTEWKQTSYNGKFRKNFAGVGYTYDEKMDAFISPKDFSSWVLDASTCCWVAPVPMPNDGLPYDWNEDLIKWDRHYTNWTPTHISTIQQIMDIAQVGENDVFLDMGCGDGRVLEKAHQLGASLIGVEINSERAALSKKNVPSANIFEGDLIDFDFSSASVILIAVDYKTIFYMHQKLKLAKKGTKIFYFARHKLDFNDELDMSVHETDEGPFYFWVS